MWIELLNGVFEPIGRGLTGLVNRLGDFLLFGAETFRWALRPPFRREALFQQMEFIGLKSIGIVLLTGAFTGMVFALQTGYAFRIFNAEIYVGSTVGLALTREIGPVFTALMVTARAGSAMAAEIGTMKVTEQVDALTAMAVNPLQFLVVPRVIAAMLMVPLLTGLFSVVGILGAYFVGTNLLGISEVSFVHKLTYHVDGDDVFGGLLKAVVFGMLLAWISCYQGYQTEGGAVGVGRATTRAVVYASVAILVTDYFLTSWILEYLPEF